MKIDTVEIKAAIAGRIREIYPDNHKLDVDFSNVKLDDVWSDPFFDGSDVVSAMLHRAELTIKITIDHEFTPDEWREYTKVTKK